MDVLGPLEGLNQFRGIFFQGVYRPAISAPFYVCHMQPPLFLGESLQFLAIYREAVQKMHIYWLSLIHGTLREPAPYVVVSTRLIGRVNLNSFAQVAAIPRMPT